jgi:GT2 family glycosyltransferase
MSDTIPVLGIPHYNRPDLLERCIRSIDHPVDTLVIIRNGPMTEFPVDFIISLQLRKLPNLFRHGTVEIVQHHNAGVAASWNETIKLFPAPYWMLVNNDIQFAPGDLAKMAAAAVHCSTPAHPRADVGRVGMLYGNHGASWFAITAAAVDEVGLFDENFYPAYLEDCDWGYRADLLGVRRRNVEGVNSFHGAKFTDGVHGSATIYSDPELRKKNGRTHASNFDYYRRKWGGNNGQEIYKTPFNEPLPVSFWKFETALRKQNQW